MAHGVDRDGGPTIDAIRSPAWKTSFFSGQCGSSAVGTAFPINSVPMKHLNRISH